MVEIFLAAKIWDSEVIGKFYRALKALPDEEKCDCTVFVAQTLSKRGGNENTAAAAAILQYALANYKNITLEAKARLHWALGLVLENDFRDYDAAYEQYILWRDLKSSVSGANIALTRCILLRDQFVYSEELEDCLVKSYADGDLGLREERLYEAIAQYIIFSHKDNTLKKNEYKTYAQAIVKADENFLPDFVFKQDGIKDKLNVTQKTRIFVKQMT